MAFEHLACEKLALSIWHLSIWQLSIWHLSIWHLSIWHLSIWYFCAFIYTGTLTLLLLLWFQADFVRWYASEHVSVRTLVTKTTKQKLWVVFCVLVLSADRICQFKCATQRIHANAQFVRCPAQCHCLSRNQKVPNRHSTFSVDLSPKLPNYPSVQQHTH